MIIRGLLDGKPESPTRQTPITNLANPDYLLGILNFPSWNPCPYWMARTHIY